MIVGIDDTDSRKGMCTTYLCAYLVDALRNRNYNHGEVSVSTPRLVRLNPSIPYKTRGNGAVAFEITTTTARTRLEDVKELVISTVSKFSELDDANTNPGVVFIEDESRSNLRVNQLKSYYERAVRTVLTQKDALAIIAESGFDYFGLKNKRGIIGALAAAAFVMLQRYHRYDFTYELMAYREKDRWGAPRRIDEHSVWEADAATYPLTWDTVDVANRRIVFAPHSPCPVLFGIRGDSVDAIYKAYKIIDSEPVERIMLFITNQGTDFHLITHGTGQKLLDYHSYILDGVVESNPCTLVGGHVLFKLSLPTLSTRVDCIAYEPTKGFRNIIRKLRHGDEVRVFGSFKRGTLNLEKIEIKSLNKEELRNPRCEQCGRSMESAGRGQGYRCKHCNTKREAKEVVTINRAIEVGLYEVPPVARRHISKPLIRMCATKGGGGGEGESVIIHPSR